MFVGADSAIMNIKRLVVNIHSHTVNINLWEHVKKEQTLGKGWHQIFEEEKITSSLAN